MGGGEDSVVIDFANGCGILIFMRFLEKVSNNPDFQKVLYLPELVWQIRKGTVQP